MRELVIKTSDFQWIDIINPSQEELDSLSEEFGVHFDHLQDSVEQSHHPKYEVRENWHFAILRNFDRESTGESDSIPELTRKLSLFYNSSTLITLHRKDQEYLSVLKRKWIEKMKTEKSNPNSRILGALFSEVVSSYSDAIEQSLVQIEEYETKIFLGSDVPRILEALYFLKRRASIYRRMVRIHGDLLRQILMELKFSQAKAAQLRDEIDRVFFQADTLHENTMHLFNAHVSISSQKTNEVMRILTVFSVFFMPLTFIVGVYGMNFQYMPELNHPSGYIYVWLVMIATCLVLGIWFRYRGWMSAKG